VLLVALAIIEVDGIDQTTQRRGYDAHEPDAAGEVGKAWRAHVLAYDDGGA
jgi:hypothetical protein